MGDPEPSGSHSGTFGAMTPPEKPRLLRYQAVKDLVLSMIDEQDLKPGDRLPSTSELAGLAEVSQISVRRALDELERAGRIQRHQGVGTFVAQPRIVSDPARSGALLTTLGDADATVGLQTELISLRVGLPGGTIASALRIVEGQPVWEVVRRRLMGGAPAIVERAVLPLQLVPALDEKMLSSGGSLYSYLADKYGLVDAYEEQYLEVTVPSAEERLWLALPAREQVVAIKGVSFDEAGTPFDCYQQVYPARRFAFFVSGSRERRLLTARAGDDWTVNSLPGT
jgi:DNA-binding GntR family transcriptional regulator